MPQPASRMAFSRPIWSWVLVSLWSTVARIAGGGGVRALIAVDVRFVSGLFSPWPRESEQGFWGVAVAIAGLPLVMVLHPRLDRRAGDGAHRDRLASAASGRWRLRGRARPRGADAAVAPVRPRGRHGRRPNRPPTAITRRWRGDLLPDGGGKLVDPVWSGLRLAGRRHRLRARLLAGLRHTGAP